MRNLLFNLLGRQFMQHTVGRHTQQGGVLDIRFGLNLMKDGRVPVVSKVTALGIGALAAMLLIALEIPLETLIALMLPFVGFLGDTAIDGLEAVIVPVVVAALLLPRLAPQHVVEQLRAEGARQVPFNDVSGA